MSDQWMDWLAPRVAAYGLGVFALMVCWVMLK